MKFAEARHSRLKGLPADLPNQLIMLDTRFPTVPIESANPARL